MRQGGMPSPVHVDTGKDLVACCHSGHRRPFTGTSAGPGSMDACCDDERSSLMHRLLWSRRGDACQVTSPDTHVDPNKIACRPRSSVSSSLPPRSTQCRPGVATQAGLDSQRRCHHTRSSSRQPLYLLAVVRKFVAVFTTLGVLVTRYLVQECRLIGGRC